MKYSHLYAYLLMPQNMNRAAIDLADLNRFKIKTL
jgi:hypothetical protein